MNRAYKLVWNTVSNSWMVASELAKGRKKSSSTALKLAVLLAGGLTAGMAGAATVVTLPTGESVVSGSASFDRSISNQLTVNQSTSKLITNWNSFDVGTGGTVVFAQPDASSIALNRVTSGSATQIAGQVSANGQLVIVNPNGITFGAGSQVSASGIVASSLDILDSDFNAGNLLFSRGAATGSIDNKGSLTATAGSVSLLGATIKNTGTVSASGGNAALINADAVNLTTAVPSISTASSITGLIQQSGSITATQVSSVGGKILLTGDTSQAASQIQLAGTLDATTNTNLNGRSILVNGDVNLNGTTNSLDLTSTSGYSLTNAAQLNLNGSSSAFSVNGTGYTVIRDVTQLQAMSSNLTGKYVLAGNIDASATAGWNSGAGFVPVGTTASNFKGLLDGLGHSISQLTNNISSGNNGLFGTVTNASVQNLILKDAALQGGTYAGLLIGNAVNGTLSVNNVMVNGTLTGGSGYVGGLIGFIQLTTAGTGTNTADIRNAYSNVAINNASRVVGGGLIGVVWNQAPSAITGSFNIQNVSSSGAASGSYAGGVIGAYQVNSTATTTLTLNNAYTDTSVTATSNGNALIGIAFMLDSGANANISNSYWNIDKTGKSVALATSGTYTANAVSSQLTGLSDAQSKQLSSYANWGSSIDAQAGTGSTWRIYDGYSGPLLRTFLKPLSSVAVGNITKTYDGTTASGSDFVVSGAGIDTSKILLNLNGGRNVGTYAVDTYSNQQGYDFAATTGGTLTINKANLTISSTDGSKTYDGTTDVSGVNAVASGGTQLFSTDTLTGGSFAFADKNAGTGKHIVVSGVTVNDGNNGGNYNVTYADNTTSTINKASLSITATDASKVYDGTTTAKSTAVIVSGNLIGGDTLNGATFNYDDKNAGTGKHVVVSDALISDGNNGGNYEVTYVDNTNSSISKRLLTISAVADSKEYDGKLTSSATAKPTVVGRQRGDSIVGLTQSFANKNAGTGKAINVDAGYTIRDGNNGNNYDVVIVNGNAGVITPKALSISAVANTKVYDGGVTSANKPSVTGLVSGDRVTGLFQQYETKTVGTGKKLLIKSGYVVNDGNGGNNYSVTEQGSTDGVITAH